MSATGLHSVECKLASYKSKVWLPNCLQISRVRIERCSSLLRPLKSISAYVFLPAFSELFKSLESSGLMMLNLSSTI